MLKLVTKLQVFPKPCVPWKENINELLPWFIWGLKRVLYNKCRWLDLQDGEKPEMPFGDDCVNCLVISHTSTPVQIGKDSFYVGAYGP